MSDKLKTIMEVQTLEKRIAYLKELSRLIAAMSPVLPLPPSKEDEFEDWRFAREGDQS